MHLVRHLTPEEYWEKWNQFDESAKWLDLTPFDRHLAWEEATSDEDFNEWPVPMEHFIDDPFYVGTDLVVRPVIREFMCDFWEPQAGHELFVFIAGIGSGKSFSASLSLLYCLYQLSCLKKPARFLSQFEGAGSLSGDAEIVLMNASAAGRVQAAKIVYGEIFEKVISSPYFRQHFQPYEGKTSELDFPNRIRLSPGSSQWQSALGWNLFAFVVDEAAFGKETESADYVKELFLALNQRRRSRFGKGGFGGLFTSPGSEYGFVELMAGSDWDTSILVRRTTTWEAKDEMKPGQTVFLLDRDPDQVRILESDLTYVRPGVCQRADGEIVRFETLKEVKRELA